MLNIFWTNDPVPHYTYNNAHIFRVFNFCTSQAIRKYFNNEIFPIYSKMYLSCVSLAVGNGNEPVHIW